MTDRDVEPSAAALRVLQEDVLAYLGAQTVPPPPLAVARRLQLRFALAWAVMAPLLEQGIVLVRSGGLVVSDTPADAPAPRAPQATGRTGPATPWNGMRS